MDATLKREGGSFRIVDGQTGIVLDADSSITLITDFIENEWDHTNGSLDLPVETDYPRGTAEELSKVKDVLGTFIHQLQHLRRGPLSEYCHRNRPY